MTLARTNVGNFDSGGSFGTGPFVTSSFTPADNSLLVIALYVNSNAGVSPSANISVAGGGWTYTKQQETDSPNFTNCMIYFTAPIGTGASMTLTFDCGADNIFEYVASVCTYTGYNVSSPVGVKGGTSGNSAPANINFTLSGSPATDSEVNAVGSIDSGNNINPNAAWTEINHSAGTDYFCNEIRTASTSSTVAFSNSAFAGVDYGASGIEIKVAPIVNPVPPQPEWPYGKEPLFPMSGRTHIGMPMQQQVTSYPQLMGQMVM